MPGAAGALPDDGVGSGRADAGGLALLGAGRRPAGIALAQIGSAPDGGITIRHGLVKSVDVLDGYVVETIPEPRVGSEPDSLMAGVDAASGGDAWAVPEGVLKQLRDGKWTVARRAAAGEVMRSAIPIGPGRVVVLFASPSPPSTRRARPGPP